MQSPQQHSSEQIEATSSVSNISTPNRVVPSEKALAPPGKTTKQNVPNQTQDEDPIKQSFIEYSRLHVTARVSAESQTDYEEFCQMFQDKFEGDVPFTVHHVHIWKTMIVDQFGVDLISFYDWFLKLTAFKE
jgi:hypothetical protein